MTSGIGAPDTVGMTVADALRRMDRIPYTNGKQELQNALWTEIRLLAKVVVVQRSARVHEWIRFSSHTSVSDGVILRHGTVIARTKTHAEYMDQQHRLSLAFSGENAPRISLPLSDRIHEARRVNR